MLAFLCGGMEYAPDGGCGWRAALRRWIETQLGHRVYDPCEESKRLLSEEDLRALPAWKTADFERYSSTMRFIVDHDLEVMEKEADYVVCYWDEAAARGAGTQGEVTVAHRKGIPVYLVRKMPIQEISGWLLGCTNRLFADFEELKAFLTASYGEERKESA